MYDFKKILWLFFFEQGMTEWHGNCSVIGSGQVLATWDKKFCGS